MDDELLRANLVRTLVPLVVGALASVPLLKGSAQFAPLIGFGVSAGYYAVFRVLETRFPWLGVFLGKRAKKDTRFTTRPSATHGVLSEEVGDTASLKVDGVDVLGVESITWEAGADGTPVLTLRILDPQVQFVSPGAKAPAASRTTQSTKASKSTKSTRAVPAPRTAETRPSDAVPPARSPG